MADDSFADSQYGEGDGCYNNDNNYSGKHSLNKNAGYINYVLIFGESLSSKFK